MPDVYSPSQTERFIRCPRLWDYSRRWIGGGRDAWLEKLTGRAIHTGLMTHYRADGEDPQEAAYATLRDEWPPDTYDVSLEGVAERVRKCLKRGLALDLGHGALEVLTEEIMGPEAATLDTAWRDEQGWHIVDWKYTHDASPWVIQKRLLETEVSWQLRHYAWRLGQEHPGAPVVEAGIALIVGGPTITAKWTPLAIEPGMIEDWYQSAQEVWADIYNCRQGISIPRAHIGQACLAYGGCPFYDGCHRMYGDESRFGTVYTVKERA